LVQAPPHVAQAAPPDPQVLGLVPGAQVVPLQQPLGQLTLSHLQTPPTQCCPAAQAGPEPHAQVPVTLQPSLVTPQATQLCPAGAQALTDAAKQVELVQQPPGHEVASHTQLPATQRWPAPHAAPPPHWHIPPEQLLAELPQSTQAAPPLPQLFSDGARQVLPLQQPLGQDAALQTQTPPMQRWPPAQIAPPPQLQAPLLHRSARVASQATQLLPPFPQAAVVGDVQVAPEQQPLGQDAELHPEHAPPEQVWPAGQAWQAVPPAPHADGWPPDWQVSPAQQPLGHELLSQMHMPLEQR